MQHAYNKKTALRDNDPSLAFIGYYTDLGRSLKFGLLIKLHVSSSSGAYYYHVTELNKTYEDTFLDLRKYYMYSGIPYK